MSGICGIFNQDGCPVAAGDLHRMLSLLVQRAPEGTAHRQEGCIGFGHTLLATTLEVQWDHQPLRHARSGCMVSADVRLDNRDELLTALHMTEHAAEMGDAGLILAAYLAWGEECVVHLRGDFAFAIWDPRRQALFCARDHFGVRPFYYHHTPGRFFAFASEPRAILVLPQIPYRINEGRIADFLVSELEGIDHVSTFFEEIYRLAPAHALRVTPEGVTQWRYWTLEAGPELKLSSDEAYAEAFLDVFTTAVRRRLRGGPVGSMLSGGVDSGSIVAVASRLRRQAGQGPLPTFSATSPVGIDCIETRTIGAALTLAGLDASTLDYEQLDDLQPALGELTWNLAEPFDYHMTLLRTMYLAAHRRGLKVLLDGIDADLVLSGGNYFVHLLRSGSWLTAYRDARVYQAFWGDSYPAWRTLFSAARGAFMPPILRQLRRRLRPRAKEQRAGRVLNGSIMNPSFARRVALADRLQTLDSHKQAQIGVDERQRRAQTIMHPYLAVGLERYDRTAAAVAIEPRHPFLDLDVVDFSLRLPVRQLAAGGWHKAILRRAMAGQLPDAVRWRPGKQHLGFRFTLELVRKAQDQIRQTLEANWQPLAPYIDVDRMRLASHADFTEDWTQASEVYEVAHLAAWLRAHKERPQPGSLNIVQDFTFVHTQGAIP
jgi:asparagine synthase (glutamine-hydrolysing)